MNVTVFIIKSDNGEFERAGKSTHTCSKPVIKYSLIIIIIFIMLAPGTGVHIRWKSVLHRVHACIVLL